MGDEVESHEEESDEDESDEGDIRTYDVNHRKVTISDDGIEEAEVGG